MESELPVCDKPYHMNNGFQQMWVEIQNLWNQALYTVTKTYHFSFLLQVRVLILHCNADYI